MMMKQTLVINVKVDVGSSSLGKNLRRSFREEQCAFVLKLNRKIEGKYSQDWRKILANLMAYPDCFIKVHQTFSSFSIFSPWKYMNILHLGGTHRYQIFRETSKSRAKSQGTQRSSQSRWVASWMTMTTPPLARNLLGSPRRRPPCKTANTITEHCKAAAL